MQASKTQQHSRDSERIFFNFYLLRLVLEGFFFFLNTELQILQLSVYMSKKEVDICGYFRRRLFPAN